MEKASLCEARNFVFMRSCEYIKISLFTLMGKVFIEVLRHRVFM